jgi:4-hydroxybenzoate polyprenyltransferase
MKKILLARALEVIYMTLIYFGAYLGNFYAEILLVTVTWIIIFTVLLIVAAFSIANSEQKMKFNSAGKPKSTMSKLYSYTYDALVFCLLFYFGYVVIACFWAGSQWLAVYVTNAIDNQKKHLAA